MKGMRTMEFVKFNMDDNENSTGGSISEEINYADFECGSCGEKECYGTCDPTPRPLKC